MERNNFQRERSPQTPTAKNVSMFNSTQMDNGYKTRTPTKKEGHSQDIIPERLNFSIESKKKASIIEKISALAPFLDSLINRNQLRSAQILDRLIDLKTNLDQIFEEISQQFEAAQVENDELRKSLEQVPRKAKIVSGPEKQKLEKMIEHLERQLDEVRRAEKAAQIELNQIKNENKTAFQILDELREEGERIATVNTQLQGKLRILESKSQLNPDELRYLKQELEKEKRKSMGAQDYTKKKLQQYENSLKNENKKYKDLQAIYNSLSRKSELNENQINELRMALEKENRKSMSMEDLIRKKIEQSEQQNNSLKRKLKQDQDELEKRLARIKILEEQNSQGEKRLKQFVRKSQLTQQEIQMIKAEFEKQRRTSMVNEDNLLRKLKALQNEKNQILRQAQQNENKAQSYEDILNNLTSEIEKQRRHSIMYERETIEKIRNLQKNNSELGVNLNNSKGKLTETQKQIRQLQNSIREKERKYKEYIQDLTRKSTLHEDQIRAIKSELDKERRKSLADEATIKKLEKVISEQTENTKEQVEMLKKQIENERRKSMADEATIKKLEAVLNEKIYFLNQSQNKNSLAENELKFLKEEIDKERRKSMADQASIKKLEQILNEKTNKLNQYQNKSSQADDDIRMLKAEIDKQRRKSMADQNTIKKLEQLLAEKIKFANQNHNKYLEMARKSELGDEQIKFLKAEIEKERRKSNADESTIKKLEQILNEKLKSLAESQKRQATMEEEMKFIKQEIENERRKSMADEMKIKKLQEILEEKLTQLKQNNEKYDEQVRKSEINQQQLRFLQTELDKERRKSMADEATIKKLEKLINDKIKFAQENQNKFINEIKFLKNEIDNERRKSMADQTRIKKLEQMLNEKVKVAEEHKNKCIELMRKTDLNEEELKILKQEIEKQRRKSLADVALIRKLEAVVNEKSKALQQKDNLFAKTNQEIQALRNEIEKERRKTLADETTIKRLEQKLNDKVNEASENYKRYLEQVRKSELNEEELNFLKGQIEKERRQSFADQQGYLRKLRELEGAKQSLMNKLEEDKQRFNKTATYIKQLEQKSNNVEKLYQEEARKSEMNAEKLNEIRDEVQKERRKSLSLEQMFMPKIHLLVDENQNLLREIDSLKGRLRESQSKLNQLNEKLQLSKEAIDYLENQSRQKANEADQLKQVLDQQSKQGTRNLRKLTDSIQQKNKQIQKLQQEVYRAKQERDRLEKQIQYKNSQLQSSKATINKLESQRDDRSKTRPNQRGSGVGSGIIGGKYSYEGTNNYEPNSQSYNSRQPDSYEGKVLQEASHVINFGDKSERQHVIKLLEYERKMYKFQTILNKPLERAERLQTFENQRENELQQAENMSQKAKQDQFKFYGTGNSNEKKNRPRIFSGLI